MNLKNPPAAHRLLPLAAACAMMAAVVPAAIASSHREAPSITTTPKVDGTDFYMFNSYETGKTGMVTLVANYLPLQDAYGGPNYFSLDPNALYEIHVDNNGDGKEELTFQFRFKNTLANSGAGITLPIGPAGATKNVAIPLRQAGQITGAATDPLSYAETYELTVVRGDRRSGTATKATLADGTSTLTKPIDYIGTKTLGDTATYDAYANKYIYTVSFPGADGTTCTGRVFVGQRKEAFSVALGTIFDLINAPASIITDEAQAASGGKFGELDNKNVTSLAIEAPASCLTAAPVAPATTRDPVIGGWTTASLRQGEVLNPSPKSGLQANQVVGGAWTQVSRLGMPLVNEVVIGLKDKDKFNTSKPVNDATNFADYVTNPTLPALIQTLFPTALAPTNFPRTDLMTAFLTGLPTVNRPASITSLTAGPLAEMLRLNTSIAPTAILSQSSLGVAGNDLAGFPNGRRLGDDVVDISLRVAMGALCVLTTTSDTLGVGCKPSDAPAGGVAFNDTVRASASDFKSVFPYLNTPLPGKQ